MQLQMSISHTITDPEGLNTSSWLTYLLCQANVAQSHFLSFSSSLSLCWRQLIINAWLGILTSVL